MNNIIHIHIKELSLMVNRLKHVRLHPLTKFMVDDMAYKLLIGSPISVADEIYIQDVYRCNFGDLGGCPRP